MATTRMTQTQLVKALAAHSEVSNKVARGFLDGLAAMAIAEVKKNGVFVVPAWVAPRPPAKPSRFRPRRS